MKLLKSRKKSTMTFHLWRDFAMFSLIIMVVLWLLQVIFLNAFYESMKKGEIEKIGDEIVELYYSDRAGFDTQLSGFSARRGVFAHVLTEDGKIKNPMGTMEEFQSHPDIRGDGHKIPSRQVLANFNPDTWQKFTQKLSQSSDNTTAYVISSRGNFRMMIYGAKLIDENGDVSYLYINSPLQPIDATRSVLQNQLIIVSVISVLASLVLAYFIARKFSRPIIKTSESAKNLALGNYDVRFEGGSYREITELTDVLNTAAGELGKIDSLRRDLMANVSHDLKTPLTIIKSYAEMIRDISGDNKEKRDAHAQVIVDESNRLSNLVNDILVLSKLQSGMAQTQKEAFDISSLLLSIMERFYVYTHTKAFNFSCNIEKGIIAIGDEAQIMQVIYNLIGNAVNHSIDKKEISISLKKDGNEVVFLVQDSGDGIDEAELPYVWDRYYRTGNSHTRDIEGTGIGLSIVKQILLGHNADFGVSTKKGAGCVFWFKLPLEE